MKYQTNELRDGNEFDEIPIKIKILYTFEC